MAKKSNIRSMRFSDKMVEIIEAQAGETFTAKFEALVTRCMWELPAKEKELAGIQKQIQQERQNLRYIQDTRRKLERNLQDMEHRTAYYLREMNRSIEELTKL